MKILTLLTERFHAKYGAFRGAVGCAVPDSHAQSFYHIFFHFRKEHIMQFFGFDHPSIRYTGRFGHEGMHGMGTTACGAYFEIAFSGREIVLDFDLSLVPDSHGHVYVSADGGALIESNLQPYIRVGGLSDGAHVLTVIHKSNIEALPRWYHPILAKCDFLGYEAEDAGVLPPDERKTIEFVGDSITEGVLIDDFRRPFKNDVENRCYQDDVTDTYGWRTAKALGLRPFMMGYGAVGVTRSGSGGVLSASESYPYNFDGSPVSFPSCDYIVINHGANDRGKPNYFECYEKLLKVVRERNPKSTIIILSPFCGYYDDTLPSFVKRYNEANSDDIKYISSHGWVTPEPLHPLRDGHKAIAEHLTAELRKVIEQSAR